MPRSVQDLIPVRTVYPDGIFEVAQGKYSRSYRFDDINYAVASGSDKESMFLKYSEILNSLDSGAVSKITVNNRRMDKMCIRDRYISDLRFKPFCDIAGRILRSSIADLNGYRAEDISEVLEYVSHEEQEGKLNDN